jgi:hypothetical protein
VKTKIDQIGNITTGTEQLFACADRVGIIARTQKALKETFITLQKEAENLSLKIKKIKLNACI